MTEAQGTGESQRYCTSCGAELRPGNAFCVSCGVPLTSSAGQPGPTDPGPEPSGRSGYSGGDFGARLRGAVARFGGVFSGLRAHGLQGVATGARRRFGRLPLAGKAGLVGLVLLVAFTVLSPVFAVIAAVAFVLSLFALIIRVGQQRSAVSSGIIAVTSLVLVLVFSGAAGVFYGGGPTAGTDSSEQESVGSSDESSAYSAPSESEEPGTGSGDALDTSDLNTASFEAQQINEVASVNNGTGLYIVGFADSLYEEDIVSIADHVASLTQQYDYVDMEVARVASEGGGVALRVGECEFSGIRIANNYNGALATGVREGFYDYTCSGGGY